MTQIDAIRSRLAQLRGLGQDDGSSDGSGADPALMPPPPPPPPPSGPSPAEVAGVSVLGLGSLIGATALAYHGYMRNGSVPWALVWAAAGSLFPIGPAVGGVIAYGQGFAQPAKPEGQPIQPAAPTSAPARSL